MQIDLKSFSRKAKRYYKENEKFFARLKRSRRKDLDDLVDVYHEQAFRKIDCLDCANCCKSISPTFEPKDIKRISKFLGLKTDAFINTYLHMDEEGDMVHNGAPCPFLAKDNKCNIYEARPEACRGYPHTDEQQLKSILDITLQNTLYCPAVFDIVENLKKEFK